MNAINMVNEAYRIAHSYQHDREHMASEEELRLLHALSETLFRNDLAVLRIIRNLHQRVHGEPEGALKFTDPSYPCL